MFAMSSKFIRVQTDGGSDIYLNADAVLAVWAFPMPDGSERVSVQLAKDVQHIVRGNAPDIIRQLVL